MYTNDIMPEERLIGIKHLKVTRDVDLNRGRITTRTEYQQYSFLVQIDEYPQLVEVFCPICEEKLTYKLRDERSKGAKQIYKILSIIVGIGSIGFPFLFRSIGFDVHGWGSFWTFIISIIVAVQIYVLAEDAEISRVKSKNPEKIKGNSHEVLFNTDISHEYPTSIDSQINIVTSGFKCKYIPPEMVTLFISKSIMKKEEEIRAAQKKIEKERALAEAVEIARSKPPMHHQNQATKICICGVPVPFSNKFCQSCGYSFNEGIEMKSEPLEMRKCVNCGVDVPISVKFCTSCGSEVLTI